MPLSRRFALTALITGAAVGRFALVGNRAQAGGVFAVTHTDVEWRKLLTADQYQVLREQGT